MKEQTMYRCTVNIVSGYCKIPKVGELCKDNPKTCGVYISGRKYDNFHLQQLQTLPTCPKMNLHPRQSALKWQGHC